MATTQRITRIGHRKSRNGCSRCKVRRVKCNEAVPCHNCARHGVQCSLSQSVRRSSTRDSISPPRVSGATISELSARAGGNSSKPNDASTRSVGPGTQETSGISDLCMKINEARRLMLEVSVTLGSSEIVSSTHAPKSPYDEHERELDEWSVRNQMQSLRLLHHYFSSAYRLLSYETATTELWRTTVPEIALTHEYLMHGILALSALHYAHTNSTQREDHLVISARYQQLALKFFSGNIGAVDDGNCEAYFLLSSIIFLLSTFRIAHSGDSGERPSPETVAQSFVLLQGIKGVLASQSLQRWVVGNPLAVLLSPRPYDQSRHELNSQLQDRICRVRQLAEEDSGFYNDGELRSNYIEAIDLLQITSTWVDPSSSEGRRRVWYWPFNLSQAFLHSLRTRQPLALILLSTFAQLVSSLEAENWLLDGWSNSVLGMIHETLDLQWRHWLGWSQEQ